MTARQAGSPAPRILVETPEEIEYELRAAEGSLWTGARLLIGVVTFAFAALAFAYFYLRSSDNGQLWRPKGVTASTSFGAAILAFTLATGLLALFGHRRLRMGSRTDWQVAGWTVVLGGIIIMVLQIWEMTRLSFYPGSSGYASCFIAWGAMNVGLILGATYWQETLLARSTRLRRAVREEGGEGTVLPTERLFRANAEGCSLFWGFVAVVGLFFWVLFYVI